jgi:hypothetical protein
MSTMRNQERTHTLGKFMRSIVIAGDIPVYCKAAILTSIFCPNLYPNPSRHHPTQTDTPRLGSPENPRP